MSNKDLNRFFVVTDSQTQNCYDNIDSRLFEDDYYLSIGDLLLLRSVKLILKNYHDVHIHNGYKS